MVLRGSKTHPIGDPVSLKQAIDHIRSHIEEARKEKSEAISDLSTFVHESEETKVYELSSQEFVDSLETIIHHLDEIEKDEHEAQLQLQKYKKELKTSLQQLMCGGIAGASARSVVAPIDRIKLLIQTRNNNSMFQTAAKIYEDGILSFWKGNGTNCIRVFPYAACQFMCYERYKQIVLNWANSKNREFGNFERLLSGGLAGATAATVTYPLDVIRVTTTVVDEVNGPRDAIRRIYNSTGIMGFYRGWVPTVMSLAPFIGINFAAFDFLKSTFIEDGNVKNANPLVTLSLGACAGLFAQSICYPLDTIRRNLQVNKQIEGSSTKYNGIISCVKHISSNHGLKGFYRGITPNAVKIVPNNGIRFLVYSHLTSYLGIAKKKKNSD